MSIIEIKQFLKKKAIILLLYIVCSLFICEKALAVWDRCCCYVAYIPHQTNDMHTPNTINIHFKFFEYDMQFGIDNSYIENFEALYSTNRGLLFKHLFSAATENQTSKTWAWINLKNKKVGSKINFLLVPFDRTDPVTMPWRNGSNPRLYVKNTYILCKHETWLWVDWHLKEELDNITHIQIKAKWHNPGMMFNEVVDLVYDITPKKGKLKSNCLNFSNSSPIQEFRTDAKKNTVKAYKKSNSIVVKGALSEKIQVYTTTGKLVKSIVADNDIVKLELSVKQVYIVKFGQVSYKIAL